MTGTSALICGIGMLTPAGGNAAQTAASVRAGINVYAESAVYNKRFEPMVQALVPNEVLPELNPKLPGSGKLTVRQTRMLQLAHRALEEIMPVIPGAFHQNVPVFLNGPENIPGREPVMQADFLHLLEGQAAVQLDLQNSLMFAAGRSGGMQALRAALDFIFGGGQRLAVVGGVDTYTDLYLLGKLDAENRILANGIMDGFAPGEGAAFLLIGTDESRELFEPMPSIRIHYPGTGTEPGHRNSDKPYSGDGLATAFSNATASHAENPIRTIFSGINGENLNAKEWGVALMRNQAVIDPEVVVHHPAECFGDAGAAAMPVLAGLASIGMSRNYVQGPVLISCSSEGAGRGAVCLTDEGTRG